MDARRTLAILQFTRVRVSLRVRSFSRCVARLYPPHQERKRREAEAVKWEAEQMEQREKADAERRATREAQAREAERESWIVMERARRAAERERARPRALQRGG